MSRKCHRSDTQKKSAIVLTPTRHRNHFGFMKQINATNIWRRNAEMFWELFESSRRILLPLVSSVRPVWGQREMNVRLIRDKCHQSLIAAVKSFWFSSLSSLCSVETADFLFSNLHNFPSQHTGYQNSVVPLCIHQFQRWEETGRTMLSSHSLNILKPPGRFTARCTLSSSYHSSSHFVAYSTIYHRELRCSHTVHSPHDLVSWPFSSFSSVFDFNRRDMSRMCSLADIVCIQFSV